MRCAVILNSDLHFEYYPRKMFGSSHTKYITRLQYESKRKFRVHSTVIVVRNWYRMRTKYVEQFLRPDDYGAYKRTGS
jgi:hypothetical protein